MDSATVYSELNDATRQIRLIRIKKDGGTLACDLDAVDLDRPPAFVALSYVWGDQTLQPETILLNGQQWKIGHNLAIALRYLLYRDHSALNYVWVDALSINQGDSVEKAAQVALMDRVYSAATLVLAHLGEDSTSTALAVPSIRRLAVGWRGILKTGQSKEAPAEEEAYFKARIHISSENAEAITSRLVQLGPAYTPEVWKSIRTFLRVPYWTRIWILQELVLGSAIELVLGDTVLPWQDLVDAKTFCQLLPRILAALPKHRDVYWFPFQQSKELDWKHIDLVERIKGHGDHILRIENKTSASHLLRVMAKTCGYLATEPRDKIFALGGVCQLPLSPDYTAPLHQIYVMFAISCILRQLHNILIWAGTAMLEPNDLKLPSWAPNWQAFSSRPSRLPFDPEWYQADGWIDPFPDDCKVEPRLVAPLVLRIQGHLWDSVEEKLPLLSLQSDELLDFCVGELGRCSNTRHGYPTGTPVLQALMRLFLLERQSEYYPPELDFVPTNAAGFDKLIEHVLTFLQLVLPADCLEDGNTDSLAMRLQRLRIDPGTNFPDTLKENFYPGCTGNIITTIDLSTWSDEALLRSFPDDTRTPQELRSIPVMVRRGVDVVGGQQEYPSSQHMRARMSSWIDAGYRIFRTKAGNVGIGPAQMGEGDVIAILDRCSVPFLLRAHATLEGKWVLVGACFVLGIMGGEASLATVSKDMIQCLEIA
jgi:hypothetical protein